MTILSPMTTIEFEQYMLTSIPDYANDKVKSGEWSETEAIERSSQEFNKALPDGVNTTDNFLFTLIDELQNQSVGILWYAIASRAGNKAAYIYDISINSDHQRKGHATRAIQALEEKLKDSGITGIGLNVFGFNKKAYELYVKQGFQPTSTKMFKPF